MNSVREAMVAWRWIPHNIMLADPMTKEVSKSNLLPLMDVMRSGVYRIAAEGDELAYRKELRESGATVARLKGRHKLEDQDEA